MCTTLGAVNCYSKSNCLISAPCSSIVRGIQSVKLVLFHNNLLFFWLVSPDTSQELRPSIFGRFESYQVALVLRQDRGPSLRDSPGQDNSSCILGAQASPEVYFESSWPLKRYPSLFISLSNSRYSSFVPHALLPPVYLSAYLIIGIINRSCFPFDRQTV